MAHIRNINNGRFTSMTIEDHIREHVFPEPNTGCWIWAGGITTNVPHYGQLTYKRKTRLAHRLLFEHFNGCILETSQLLCHTCDNTLCVNPDHLFIGTTQDNMDDMVSKGRSLFGERNPKAKLTGDDVLNIRRYKIENPNTPNHKIGEIFSLPKATIQGIVSGKTWKHLL